MNPINPLKSQVNGMKSTDMQLLPLIMNNIPQAVFWKDRELVYLGCNRAFAEDAGFSTPEEIIGKTDFDMPWKEQAELYRADDRRVMEDGEPKLNYEEPQTAPDGSMTWLRTSKIPVSENGQVVAVLGMYEDITEHKQAEITVMEREARFRQFSEAAVEGMVFHEQGNIIDVNLAIVKMYGFSNTAEVIGRNLMEFVAPESRPLVLQQMQMEAVQPYEIVCVRRDGSTFPVETSSYIYQAGSFTLRATSIRDISERKRAEAAIVESEERFRRFSEATIEGLVFHDRGQIIDANMAAITMFRLASAADIINRNLLEFILPDSHKLVLQQMQLESVDPYEIQGIRADGTIFPVETSTRMYKVGDRTIRASSLRDITERKRAEQTLQENRRLLQLVMDNIPQAVFWKDKNLTYLGTNQAFAQDAGLNSPQELIGKTDFDMPWKDQAELYRADDSRVLESGEIKLNYEEPQTGPTGEVTWLRTSKIPMRDVDGNIFAVLGMYEDITEWKRLQQRVQEAFERRGYQVQISTEISQEIASASELGELFERVVLLTKERLGYYHTQLLRYDPAQDAVLLVYGYGEIGAQMLAQSHRLPLGTGLIGTAAATGETVMRPILAEDPEWQANPLLPETRGEIAVPIKLRNRVMGVLDVQSDRAGAISDDDRLLLEGLCGQIAVAIEQTRLRQEMAARLEEIDRLYRTVSHEGWRAYRERASAPAGFAFDQGEFLPVQNSGLAEELFSNIPLAAPGGELIGTLAVAADPLHPLSPEDQTFLQQISEQVALALESARLFEQNQTALSEVARRASELESVATVSVTASTALNPETLLQSVVDLAKERFGIYHAHIYLIDEARQNLLLTAGAGEIGLKMVAEKRIISLDAEKSLVVRAARERQAVIVNDVHAESDFLPNPLLPETRSEMAVPMIVGETVLGIFDVQSNQVKGFTKEDASIYVTLASQVAVALQNARLYEKQAATVTQLRELDRLKSSFLANMSHELRTPLNSILGFSDVMLEEIDGPLTEMMDNDLRLIQKNGQHLLNLINDILDISKIDAGRMSLHPEQFNVHELIGEVISITSSLANEKSLVLAFEEDSNADVEIFADRTRIQQVMINVVNNAIKFTPSGKIVIRVEQHDARVAIRISDTGIGIPAEYLETIFQEFSQVDTSTTRKVGGTGLGLPISRRLIVMHGGRLWAESAGPGQGSVFYIELPLKIAAN
jgi:PAS domain S-box-containing protein